MSHYMIRIAADAFKDLDDAIATLESLGVILDKDFGPVPLDLKCNQFLLRGVVRPETFTGVELVAGVEFFPDPSIGNKPALK